jgi:purine nucleoside phosphorylase
LDPALRQIALEERGELVAAEVGHVMVRGPFFEGRRYDKKLLAASGASMVGMSILPETCVAALYPGTRVLALCFVTNTAVEEHSHEENLARAKTASALLGGYLTRIVSRIS